MKNWEYMMSAEQMPRPYKQENQEKIVRGILKKMAGELVAIRTVGRLTYVLYDGYAGGTKPVYYGMAHYTVAIYGRRFPHAAQPSVLTADRFDDRDAAMEEYLNDALAVAAGRLINEQ